jgi:hypothetical protein
MKLKSLLLAFFCIFSTPLSISVYGQTNYKEKTLEYVDLGMSEYKAKNYASACARLNLAKAYSEMQENQKITADIAALAAQACNMDLKQDLQKLNQMIENSPYKAECKKVNAARKVCSQSGNYDNCMQINYGTRYKNFDGMAVCAFN